MTVVLPSPIMEPRQRSFDFDVSLGIRDFTRQFVSPRDFDIGSGEYKAKECLAAIRNSESLATLCSQELPQGSPFTTDLGLDRLRLATHRPNDGGWEWVWHQLETLVKIESRMIGRIADMLSDGREISGTDILRARRVILLVSEAIPAFVRWLNRGSGFFRDSRPFMMSNFIDDILVTSDSIQKLRGLVDSLPDSGSVRNNVKKILEWSERCRTVAQ